MRDGDQVSVLLKDDRLRRPATFAEGPDGAIDVTTSRIQDSAFFKPGAPPNLPTQLWRVQPAGEATGSVRPGTAALRPRRSAVHQPSNHRERTSMVDASQIREHAEVVGSDGQHVGTVDKVEGGRIKLTKTDPAAQGQHHYLHLDMVASVEGGKVRLTRTAAQARDEWGSEAAGAEPGSSKAGP